MPKEADILGAAIAATENEIFGDAFGREENTLDESGDRSLEQMGTGLEGQIEPEDDDENSEDETGEESETEGEQEQEQQAKDDETKGKGPKGQETQPKPKAAAEQPEKPEGRVPAGRLREQTAQTKAVEAERDALKEQIATKEKEFKTTIDALNARFDNVLANLRQTQQPAQQTPKAEAKPDAPPDLFEDPKAYAEYVQKAPLEAINGIQRKFEELRINNSMNIAKSRHGDTFDAAMKALTSLDRSIPDNMAMGQRIIQSPDPGEAMVQWHKRNEVLRTVGDDPAKFEQGIAEKVRNQLMADPEFRKQVIAELNAEAQIGDNGRPRTMTRVPRSLNAAGGSNLGAPNDRSALDGSESAIFDSVFNTA